MVHSECFSALLIHVCVSSTEEISISISVSNCQIQENVVSGASSHCEAVARPPCTACVCMRSHAIRVVVKSEIVSYRFFPPENLHVAQTGKLQKGFFFLVSLLYRVKVNMKKLFGNARKHFVKAPFFPGLMI